MKVVINLQEGLSKTEQEAFEAQAKLNGRKPDQHLKALLFGTPQPVRKPKQKGGTQ